MAIEQTIADLGKGFLHIFVCFFRMIETDSCVLRGFKQTAIQLDLMFHIGKMAYFPQQIFLMS